MKTLFFILTISVISFFHASAQSLKTIQLKHEANSYTPKTYYISDVTTSLPDSVGIGSVNDSGVVEMLVIKDGAATAIRNYIDKNIKQYNTQPPVVMNIKELHVDIKRKASKWTVSIATTFEFYSGDTKLWQFTSSSQNETKGDPVEYLEKEIRHAVQTNMEAFEKWWAPQKDKHATSDQVKINATISKTSNMKNFIVYDLRRPLQLRDFKGEVRDDLPEKATTVSGHATTFSQSVQKGQKVINIVVTPYFDKDLSWFNPVNTNALLLAHEQAHFDITAIKVCELVNALRNARLTKENYQQRIDELEKLCKDETDNEQNTYDTETAHGTIPDKQQVWQDKISKQVKACGCY